MGEERLNIHQAARRRPDAPTRRELERAVHPECGPVPCPRGPDATRCRLRVRGARTRQGLRLPRGRQAVPGGRDQAQAAADRPSRVRLFEGRAALQDRRQGQVRRPGTGQRGCLVDAPGQHPDDAKRVRRPREAGPAAALREIADANGRSEGRFWGDDSRAVFPQDDRRHSDSAHYLRHVQNQRLGCGVTDNDFCF